MTKMMKLNYDDEKSSYGNDLIKRAQFLQKTENRLRVFDAFLAQINDVFDPQTASAIKEQIDHLQYQLWQREVDRVESGIKTRRRHAKEKAEQAEKKENSDDSDNDSDQVKNNVTPKKQSDNVTITLNKSENHSDNNSHRSTKKHNNFKRHAKGHGKNN